MTLVELAIGYLWVAMGLTAVVLVLGGREAGRQARQKKPRDFSQAKGWLAYVLKSGYDGCTVAFIDEISQRRIEFSKKIRAKGDYGIWLSVPAEAAWAGPGFAPVKVLCDDLGVAGQIEPLTDQGPESRFRVNFRQDADKAHTLALAIWTRIFKRSVNDSCKIEAQDISTTRELIDDPDQRSPWSGRTPTPEEMFIEMLSASRRLTGRSVGGHLFLILFAITFIVSLFALPTTTILAYGSVPDWLVEIGGLTVRGSNAGLTWFILGCLSFAGTVYIQNKRNTRTTDRSSRERLTALGIRLHFATILFAVLLVWTGQ